MMMNIIDKVKSALVDLGWRIDGVAYNHEQHDVGTRHERAGATLSVVVSGQGQMPVEIEVDGGVDPVTQVEVTARMVSISMSGFARMIQGSVEFVVEFP